MVEIKEGLYYRAQNGCVMGPALLRDESHHAPYWSLNSQSHGHEFGYHDDGKFKGSHQTYGQMDLASEIVGFAVSSASSPIITVTRREIQDGEYGRFSIMKHEGKTVLIGLSSMGDLHFQAMTAEELREAAHLFNQIAEFLEDGE